jgi:phospholipid/cholesterol/gamma-HCH transport system substrate-binding protein
MEIRARYLLIGLFVLAAAAASVGFIYWLSNTGGLGERTAYQVRFDGPVSGLSRGSEVLFNGIVVGEVTGLGLVIDSPGSVVATIAVNSTTPVRSDTSVGLDFRGLTGTATVALAGGSADAPPPAMGSGGLPLLVADPSALKDMSASARDVLTHLDTILTENSASLKTAISDIATFAEALSRNSDKVDGILAGLAKLTGAGGEAKTVNYDLSAPHDFSALDTLPTAQLVVAEPTTVVALDTQRIMMQTPEGDIAAFPEARWADSLPLLLGARIIQGFENAGYLRVGNDSSGLAADYELHVDLRQFHIATIPAPATAEIEFSAKLVDADGKLADARIFRTNVAAPDIETASGSAAALDRTFNKAATEMIVWALAAMESSPAPAENLAPPADSSPDGDATPVP